MTSCGAVVRWASIAAAQAAAGVLLATLLAVYQDFLRDTMGNTTIDLLHFSLHPWDGARVSLSTLTPPMT